MMRSRGFSLIEVLIAILVLAVGLLGLGAVFPAVIAQQRAATDSTEAMRATEYTKVQLFESDLVDFDDLIEDGSIPITLAGFNQEMYDWDGGQTDQHTSWDKDTGMLTLPTDGANTTDVRTRRQIPMRARLFPEAFSGTEPRYIWDAITHRNRVTENIEVAVFIRRIDGGIRVPKGWQLSNLLVGLSPSGVIKTPEESLKPIALDETTDRLVRPSGGVNEIYAVPQIRQITVTPEKDQRLPVSDRFTVRTSDEIDKKYLRIKGQKFVDDFGVIRKVVEVDARTNEIVVSPPFRGAELDAKSIVFTPDIPIRIRVFAIEGGN